MTRRRDSSLSTSAERLKPNAVTAWEDRKVATISVNVPNGSTLKRNNDELALRPVMCHSHGNHGIFFVKLTRRFKLCKHVRKPPASLHIREARVLCFLDFIELFGHYNNMPAGNCLLWRRSLAFQDLKFGTEPSIVRLNKQMKLKSEHGRYLKDAAKTVWLPHRP